MDIETRGRWKHWFEFFFTCLGYIVGLGNIWRFPYICYKNGGGVFVLVYLLCLLVIALPIVFIEIAIAQYSGLCTTKVWRCCPLFQGIGYAMITVVLLASVYYNVIVSWTLYYLSFSFSYVLPWMTCDNAWNTPSCFNRQNYNDTAATLNMSVYNTSTLPVHFDMKENLTLASNVTYTGMDVKDLVHRKSPTEEYWEHYVLQLTDGIHDLGGLQWRLTLCLLAAWVFVFLALIKGIKSSGKVMVVMATLPYILLLVLFVRGLTLPGSMKGLHYYWVPNWSKLLDLTVWTDAANQAFYSSAVGIGVLFTVASFNGFHNNCYRDAMILPVIDGLTSIFAGVVVFLTLGYMAHTTNTDIGEVVKQGPGIAFMVYPEALSTLPVPQAWSVIFFSMMFIVGMDSQIVFVQTLLTNILDHVPKLRRREGTLTLLCCVILFLLGIIFTTQGGVYILHVIDYYIPVLLVLFGFLEVAVLSWIYGSTKLLDNIELMIGYRPNQFWRILWLFICPICTFVIWVINISKMTPVTYGTTAYPQWAIAIGWLTSAIAFLIIPLGMALAIRKNKGSFFQRLRASIKPDKQWKPALSKNDEVETTAMNTVENL